MEECCEIVVVARNTPFLFSISAYISTYIVMLEIYHKKSWIVEVCAFYGIKYYSNLTHSHLHISTCFYTAWLIGMHALCYKCSLHNRVYKRRWLHSVSTISSHTSETFHSLYICFPPKLLCNFLLVLLGCILG